MIPRIALEHSDEESDAEELDGDNSGDGALVVYDPNKNPPPQQKNLNTFLLKPPSLTVAIDKAVDKRSARMALRGGGEKETTTKTAELY